MRLRRRDWLAGTAALALAGPASAADTALYRRGMDLAEFLLARCDEDESAARAVLADVDPDGHGSGWSTAAGWAHNDPDAADVASAAFVRRWSPERVLAECSARRRLIERRDPGTLAALVLPFTTHPDFDRSWLRA